MGREAGGSKTSLIVSDAFIFSGNLNVSQSKRTREAVCTITKADFTLVITGRHFLSVEVRDSFPIQNVECYSQATSTGERLFIMQRMDRKPLVREEVRLEMMSTSEDSEAWVNAFKTVGIFKELRGDFAKVSSHLRRPAPTPPASSRDKTGLKSFRTRQISRQEQSATEQILQGKDLQDQTKMLKSMIEDYMRITDKTIKDLVPKYIVLTLVKTTQDYVKKELVGDVLNGKSEEGRGKLLQVNQEYEANINELLQLRTATRQAMDVFMKLQWSMML